MSPISSRNQNFGGTKGEKEPELPSVMITRYDYRNLPPGLDEVYPLPSLYLMVGNTESEVQKRLSSRDISEGDTHNLELLRKQGYVLRGTLDAEGMNQFENQFALFLIHKSINGIRPEGVIGQQEGISNILTCLLPSTGSLAILLPQAGNEEYTSEYIRDHFSISLMTAAQEINNDLREYMQNPKVGDTMQVSYYTYYGYRFLSKLKPPSKKDIDNRNGTGPYYF